MWYRPQTTMVITRKSKNTENNGLTNVDRENL